METLPALIFDAGGVIVDWRADLVAEWALSESSDADRAAVRGSLASLCSSSPCFERDATHTQNLFSSSAAAAEALQKKNGTEKSEQFVLAEQLFGKKEWQMIDRGIIEVEEGAKMLSQRLGFPESFVLKAFNRVPETLIPFPETVELMKRLCELGYPIYILSNMPANCFHHLATTYDFFKYTKGWVVSSQEKLQKPEPEMFNKILRRYNLDPSKCIFIDDVAVNIQGAERMGIKTIFHKNAKETQKELEERFNIKVSKKRVIIGCDHGGFGLKQEIIANIKDYDFEDVGVYKNERVDYPDYASAVCTRVASGEFASGIVVCGTGIGISIAANKFNGIRCALCHDHFTAKLTRQHNDANVLALGGRTTGPEVALEIVRTFLETDFDGGRHKERIAKISEIEKKQQCH
eukprot:TRINITY_DN1349_c0_g2_i1.p1 TRINITY_DN1349_c0_g2~~TRINITY_DN1349_c0_g2_i1.p1  ORF type:complete len:415 (-),score=106.68 TRINITY_DN1349_c0_g2_i1:33-1250(-)